MIPSRARRWTSAVFALALAPTLAAPGPAFAQHVAQAAAGGQAGIPAVPAAAISSLSPAGPAAATLSAQQGLPGVIQASPLPAVNFTAVNLPAVNPSASLPFSAANRSLSLTRPAGGPGLDAAAPAGRANSKLPTNASSARGAALSLPAARPPAVSLPAAQPPAFSLPAAHRGLSKPAAAGDAASALRLAASALAGDAGAGRLRPGLSRLGDGRASPDLASPSRSALRASAERAFVRRAGMAENAAGPVLAAETAKPGIRMEAPAATPAAEADGREIGTGERGSEDGGAVKRPAEGTSPVPAGPGQQGRSPLPSLEPIPPAKSWEKLGPAPRVEFNGETLPAYAMRPQAPVRDLLVKAIDASKESIELALYDFSLPEALAALRRARDRGVEVRLVLDFGHVFPRGTDASGDARERSDEIQALLDEKFDVRVLSGVGAYGSLHDKFAVFDRKLVQFGSYNWSWAADGHFENIVFTADPARAGFYGRLWERLRELSVAPSRAKRHDWGSLDPGEPPADGSAPLEFNGRKFPRAAASPLGNIEALLIAAIEAAGRSIEVAMFCFTSRPLAEALLAARRRGVHVRIVLDEQQARHSLLDEWFAYHGLDVRIANGPGAQEGQGGMFRSMHHKFMVVDGALVETGSYNFTNAAQSSNFETANFLAEPPVVEAFRAAFQAVFDSGRRPRRPAHPPEIKPLPRA